MRCECQAQRFVVVYVEATGGGGANHRAEHGKRELGLELGRCAEVAMTERQVGGRGAGPGEREADERGHAAVGWTEQRRGGDGAAPIAATTSPRAAASRRTRTGPVAARGDGTAAVAVTVPVAVPVGPVPVTVPVPVPCP